MKMLWKKENEHDFFIKSLNFATPEQLFYATSDKKFYAYWQKVMVIQNRLSKVEIL